MGRVSLGMALRGGYPIAANTDMDDITEIGTYYCGSNATAQTLSNCPVGSGFMLYVSSGIGSAGYPVQRLVALGGSEYVRAKSSASGAFGTWKQTQRS